MIGTIEVTIRIRLDQDITIDEARKFVDEMDYTIADTTGHVSICETEVVGNDIGEDSEEDIEDRDRRHGTYGPEYTGEKF